MNFKMKTFSEWLILENYWRNDPELNKTQIMGWSLPTGTLPPWSYEHDEGLKFRENAPEDFVAPDAGGGQNGQDSGKVPNGKAGAGTPANQQASKQTPAQQQSQAQQSQQDSKLVKCPHCGKQFKA